MRALLVVSAWVLASVGMAQTTPTPDPSVAKLEAALKSTDLKFAPTTSGLSFSVDFDHAGKPTRRVFLTKTATPLLGLQLHSIYTSVWIGSDGKPPSAAVLESLMTSRKKVGTFYLFKDSSGAYSLRFGVTFNASRLSTYPAPAETGVTTLQDLIYFVDAVGEETADKIAAMKPS